LCIRDGARSWWAIPWATPVGDTRWSPEP
jgi:hypothetical protein